MSDAKDPERGAPKVTTLVGILAFAAALRVVAWLRALMMMNDGPDFLWQAQRLLEGQWELALQHPYHPLYAGGTALVSLLGVELVDAAVVVSVLGGLAAVLASWGLARCAFPRVPAAPAAAALVAAVSNRFLAFSSDVQSDGLFIGLGMLALWAVVSAARAEGAKGRLALAGLLVGLTYLVRPEGLFVAFPLGLWVVGGATPAARRLAGAAVFGVALAVVVVPYVVALHEFTGVWGLSLKPSLQFAGLRDAAVIHEAPASAPLAWDYVPMKVSRRKLREAQEAAEAERDGRGGLEGLPEVQAATEEPKQGAAGPGGLLEPLLLLLPGPRAGWDRAVTESLRQFASSCRPELLLLVLLGLPLLLREDRRLALGLLLTVLGWLAITTWHMRSSDYLTNRHFLLAQGPLLPVAGLGLLALWRPGRSGGAVVATRTLAVLALFVAALTGAADRRSDNGPRLEALAWVREHTEPGETFATHRRRDGWYAERTALSTRMPVGDGMIAHKLATNDVRWLVYDEDKIAEHHPHWFTDGLVREVERFEAEGGDTVLVLEPRFP